MLIFAGGNTTANAFGPWSSIVAAYVGALPSDQGGIIVNDGLLNRIMTGFHPVILFGCRGEVWGA